VYTLRSSWCGLYILVLFPLLSIRIFCWTGLHSFLAPKTSKLSWRLFTVLLWTAAPSIWTQICTVFRLGQYKGRATKYICCKYRRFSSREMRWQAYSLCKRTSWLVLDECSSICSQTLICSCNIYCNEWCFNIKLSRMVLWNRIFVLLA